MNKDCVVDSLPVRYKIYDGEIQCRCRVCKTITAITYLKNTKIYGTVIRNIG